MTITALAPWFGSNHTLGKHVGAALGGCDWVGVPFAGGMAGLKWITARTLAVNDLHKLIINMARVVARQKMGAELYRRLRRKVFHPDELAEAQLRASTYLSDSTLWETSQPNLDAAEAYFVCAWMARSGQAGTKNELKAGLASRWEAGGGDSVVRFRSATRALLDWRRILSRAQFDGRCAFAFLADCKDAPKHGVYCDPPFPGPGTAYKHNCGKAEADQRAWHAKLRDALLRFKKTKIVCRFYSHPTVSRLYPGDEWEWRSFTGRKASNADAPELLLIRN